MLAVDMGYRAVTPSDNRAVGFERLVDLGSNWLWSGPEGGVGGDLYQDGTVNLLDFARLANAWLGNE